MPQTRAKGPTVPSERGETARRAILAALEAAGEPLSAKDISQDVSLSEKDVYAHLEHIQKSLHHSGRARLEVTPAECKQCGFIFAKRDRLTRPSKCPVCKAQQIEPPLFAVVETGREGETG